jgi:hypothetical protein
MKEEAFILFWSLGFYLPESPLTTRLKARDKKTPSPSSIPSSPFHFIPYNWWGF